MKCFYHKADFDGKCSGAIVKHSYPECKMIGINYGDEFPWDTIQPDEIVYMVDFSLQPFSDMVRLNEMCKFHWIDHHKTANESASACNFEPSGGFMLGIEFAACELTWHYLHAEQSPHKVTIPQAVHLLGRYDVWDHQDPNVLSFQYGMRTVIDTSPENQAFWSLFFNEAIDEDMVYEVIETGRTILDYETLQNALICKAESFETELNGLPAICINRGMVNSSIFDSVYDPEKHKIMISFSRSKSALGKWKVSLRTTHGNVSCGDIAALFGGGGHSKSAGFVCNVLPFEI